MDGDPVTGEPSRSDDISLAEMFAKMCPAYMSMGMTYEQYWHSNTAAHKAYREAHEMQRRTDEWARWRQGEYIYDALLCVAPVMRAALSKTKVEPGKYLKEPYPLTQREAEERQERDARERYQNMRAKLMAEAKAAREKRKEASEG